LPRTESIRPETSPDSTIRMKTSSKAPGWRRIECENETPDSTCIDMLEKTSLRAPLAPLAISLRARASGIPAAIMVAICRTAMARSSPETRRFPRFRSSSVVCRSSRERMLA